MLIVYVKSSSETTPALEIIIMTQGTVHFLRFFYAFPLQQKYTVLAF